MTRVIIAIFAILLIIIVGTSWYLQPNDLVDCQEVPNQNTSCQSVDAIVAISGGDTNARANWAISLYKKGWADRLIFSGAASDKSGPSNAAVMKKLALDAGVTERNIYIDEKSETTGENAKNVSKIFKENRIGAAILVTSGYHQRRAYLEFKKHAANTTIFNGPVLMDRDWSFWWWTNIRGWLLMLSELVKIIVFFVTGI